MMKAAHRRACRTAGFSLIELMVTVAIVGILAAIALPSYTQHIRKARRAAAQSFMMDAANREEQMMLDRRSYVAVANNAAFTTAPPTGLNMTVPGSGSDVDVADYYALSVTIVATPPSYIISATAVGDQVNDKASGTFCTTLNIDSTGSKKNPVDTSVCW